MRPFCIYHGNCADGFTSAWVVNKYFRNAVDLYAGTYQQPPPKETEDRFIILVDFSYKRDIMLEMAKKARGVLVLDHHKSAWKDLEPANSGGVIIDFNVYSGKINWGRFLENCELDQFENCPGRIYTLFDMNRSGAGITWDFFYPNQPRPEPLNHVEDRDLWRFALPGTREIQANMFSYPYKLDIWDLLMKTSPTDLAKDGAAIERKHFKDVAELVKVVTRRMTIGGHDVPIANLPYVFVSDAANALAEGEPFAGCYWDTPQGRCFGLRSTDKGLDVSEIAKLYGGGGHRNAAGFTIPFALAHSLEIETPT